MRKNITLLAITSLLVPLAVGQSATLMFGCAVAAPPDSQGPDANDNTAPTGDDPLIDVGDGTVDPGTDPADPGTDPVDPTTDPEVPIDVGTVGDASCLTVAEATSETELQCSSGPCGMVRWQNDCGESVVVIMLNSDRDRVIQIMGITAGGFGTAIVDPEDWSADMAYGVVNGTDAIQCGATTTCSVQDLVDRGLLDLDQLVLVIVN